MTNSARGRQLVTFVNIVANGDIVLDVYSLKIRCSLM
jgi:hypothetical protein